MLLTKYLKFHFITGPTEIVRLIKNLVIFLYHYFSIGLLSRTLFAPWKQIYKPRSKYFSFSEWLDRASYNLISRIIGSIIRSMVIFIGILEIILVVLIGGIVLIVWTAAIFLTIPIYLSTRQSKRETKNKKELEKFFKKRFFGIPLASVPLEDKEAVTDWYQRSAKKRQEKRKFWELENLLSTPGIGKDWTAGYTPNLDKYTIDLSAPKPYSSHLVGRKKEAQRLEHSLSNLRGGGCLLVGEPGIGKQTIVENFAKKSYEGKTLPSLERKRILLLNPTPILAESTSQEKAKEKMTQILNEAAWAKNVILVFDNFDEYVSSRDSRIDLTTEFIRAIEQKKLLIIGMTTNKNFQKYIRPNSKLLKHMEKIDVTQPTKEEALIILQKILPRFEIQSGVIATFPALKEIINLSDKWVTEIPFPEKAIDLLDSSLTYAKTNLDTNFLLPEHVQRVLTDKTKIPLESLSTFEKERLSNIESILHQRIVNQNQAINQIAIALRRRKAGIAEDQRPIGSFLFLGPTGVGKTETAKALAEFLFNSEKNLIRLDMSTFQGSEGIKKIIGSFQREEPGILTSAVREKPHSVLLLDEIEKAPLEILNLFLTAIDEGYITDAFNEKVSFRNLMIIGTSNAGAEFIRQKLNSGTEISNLAEQLIDHVLKQGIFTPELINRFDAVVCYKPLGREELIKISRLMLDRLNQRLAEKKLKLNITDQLVERVAELGFDPVFGARPMKRVIGEKIEDKIAQKILAGEVKKGEIVDIQI